MALLEISNLSVVFGGLKALCDFDLSLEQGELVGLIGPNGAGKTTTFNIVTGVYRPAAGGVRLGGRSIAGLNPYQINHRGIARTFQNIRLFAGMSVLDNVLVGFNQSLRHGFVGTVLRTPRHQREDKRNQDRAMELLAKLGLDDRAMETAHNLPYGDQRRLEIARALATNPKILLLDEPAAGMNPQEKIELAAMIEMINTLIRITPDWNRSLYTTP